MSIQSTAQRVGPVVTGFELDAAVADPGAGFLHGRGPAAGASVETVFAESALPQVEAIAAAIPG